MASTATMTMMSPASVSPMRSSDVDDDDSSLCNWTVVSDTPTVPASNVSEAQRRKVRSFVHGRLSRRGTNPRSYLQRISRVNSNRKRTGPESHRAIQAAPNGERSARKGVDQHGLRLVCATARALARSPTTTPRLDVRPALSRQHRKAAPGEADVGPDPAALEHGEARR
jgi:hypothetical protein